jgi:hypothetical protein
VAVGVQCEHRYKNSVILANSIRLILLESAFLFSIFADAFEMHRRVKAAAQHSSSELGSAFALHFTCNRN